MQNYNTGLAGSYLKESGLDLGKYGSSLTSPTTQIKPYTDTTPFINGGQPTKPMDSEVLSGLNSWVDKNKTAIGAGFGVAQLGLGLAGFLDNQKTAGLQRDILKQQIGSNRTEIANREKFLSSVGNLKSVTG